MNFHPLNQGSGFPQTWPRSCHQVCHHLCYPSVGYAIVLFGAIEYHRIEGLSDSAHCLRYRQREFPTGSWHHQDPGRRWWPAWVLPAGRRCLPRMTQSPRSQNPLCEAYRTTWAAPAAPNKGSCDWLIGSRNQPPQRRSNRFQSTETMAPLGLARSMMASCSSRPATLEIDAGAFPVKVANSRVPKGGR